MPKLVDSDFLADIDEIRSIPDLDIGVRPYTCLVRVRAWSGSSLGEGTATDTDTAVTVGSGANPKVRRVAYKETVAAGGRYQDGDFRVGPLTPDYVGGGVAFTTMAPAVGSSPTEVYYRLIGPDTPSSGTWCQAVGEEADHALHRYLVLRPTGTVP